MIWDKLVSAACSFGQEVVAEAINAAKAEQRAQKTTPVEPKGVAKNRVLESLTKLGIKEGWLEETKERLLVVEDAAMSFTSDYDLKYFSALRDQCFEKTLSKARFDILQCLQSKDSGDILQPAVGADTESVEGVLTGATVLLAAEAVTPEQDCSVFEIAIAFIFGKKLKERIEQAMANPGHPMLIGDEAISNWIAKQNLAVVFGPRAVKDKTGVFHMLGIAAVDASAFSSIEKAESFAKDKASQYAAIPFPTSITAKRTRCGGTIKYDVSAKSVLPPLRTNLIQVVKRVHPLANREMIVAIMEAAP